MDEGTTTLRQICGYKQVGLCALFGALLVSLGSTSWMAPSHLQSSIAHLPKTATLPKLMSPAVKYRSRMTAHDSVPDHAAHVVARLPPIGSPSASRELHLKTLYSVLHLDVLALFGSLVAIVVFATQWWHRRPSHSHFATRTLGSCAMMATSGTVEPCSLPLSTGITMKYLSCEPTKPSTLPLVLFVHGSLHGAWCWAKHWMPYLANHGIGSVAINLRGTSGAPPPPGYNDGKKLVPLEDHLQDLSAALIHFANQGRPVVLVGHSFGALMAMKLMERPEIRALCSSTGGATMPALAGLSLLCSVPPVGNGPMVGRMLKETPVLAFKVTWGLAAKRVKFNVDLCREVFFNKEMPAATVEEYMRHFCEDGDYSLNLSEVNANLPVLTADASGQASWVGDQGLSPASVLVLGSEKDIIVDTPGLQETGRFCGTQPVILKRAAHDVMLDSEAWQDGAEKLQHWVESLS
uniref:AB hydrolase-1 domain-containing protein n=1 Tax=Eutreptiella gymnastica TaxID=73025 RepID=A0A7S4LBB4_9EUGL